MTNKRIRIKLLEYDLKQWNLAKIMGVSEATIYRRLREELPEDEQDRIIGIIEEAMSND